MSVAFAQKSPYFSGSPAGSFVVLPGFCDVHVHFREPGFSYKETIQTGSRAAAASGYTTVCMMPNVKPVPDSPEHLEEMLRLSAAAPVAALPYGSITVAEAGRVLSDLEGLAPLVVGFSDDGVGVADEGIMREAMQRCRVLEKVIAGHCEDMRYESPREREWREVERNIRLADETGCAFHACHISTIESLECIREAKRSGVDVTCETAPHYLLLDIDMLEDDGRFRMNPPIGTAADREALLEALCDGTVDMIATDHAPHSAEEKSRGFQKSLNGIVGLETAFPVLYTGLVRKGILSLDTLADLMSTKPRERFGLQEYGGESWWDLETEYRIDPERFFSKGRSTPFAGWQVYGRCVKTVYHGNTVYEVN